jgi:hypothetical protein
MQKWEYLEMTVKSKTGKVVSINGETTATTVGFFSKSGEPTLGELLNKIGGEGWEIVTACVNDTNFDGGILHWTLIAKRPAS